MAFKERKLIEIPEGKEIKEYRLICKKHGDVSEGTVAFEYNETDKDDKVTVKRAVYCLACINEFLQSLQKEGKLSTIGVLPVLVDKNSNEDKKEEPSN